MESDTSIFRLWSFLLLFSPPKDSASHCNLDAEGFLEKTKRQITSSPDITSDGLGLDFSFSLPFHPCQTHQQLFAGCASCGGEEAPISADEK